MKGMGELGGRPIGVEKKREGEGERKVARQAKTSKTSTEYEIRQFEKC